MTSHLMYSHSLPTGWRWVKLKDVGEFVSGGTPSKSNDAFWGGSIPFVTGADITDFYVDRSNARAFLSKKGYDSGKTACCSEGTVLFVTRTRVGRVGIAKEVMAASQDLSPYICGDQLIPEYVCHYLLSISDILQKNCRGATIQGLTREFVNSIEIPLAPIKEQRQIVLRLKEQLAGVQKAQKAAEDEERLINSLWISYLNEAFFSGKYDQHFMRRIQEVAELNPSRPRDFKRADDEATSFIPMSSVDEFTGTVVMGQQRSYSEIKKGYTCFAENDVLFAKITPCMQNGKHFVARNLIDGIGFGSTEFHVIRPKKDKVLSEWIWHFIRHPQFLKAAMAHFTGAVGQQRVPEGFISEYRIPVPQISVQQTIVHDLNNKTEQLHRIRQAVLDKLSALEVLPTAILRREFIGGDKHE